MKDDATLLLLARKVARRLLGLDVRSIGRSTFEHALSRRIDALSVTEQRYHDILLIAGKGHEAYQQIGTERFAFSDQDVVRQLLKAS